MKTETETGAMWPQAKDFCSHQNLGKTRRDSPLEPPGAAQPGGHLSFRLTASRAVRKSISAVVAPSLWYFVTTVKETIQRGWDRSKTPGQESCGFYVTSNQTLCTLVRFSQDPLVRQGGGRNVVSTFGRQCGCKELPRGQGRAAGTGQEGGESGSWLGLSWPWEGTGGLASPGVRFHTCKMGP